MIPVPGLVHGIVGDVGMGGIEGVIHEVHGDIGEVYGEIHEEIEAVHGKKDEL